MPKPSRVPGDENRARSLNRALLVIAVSIVLSPALPAQQTNSSQLPYTGKASSGVWTMPAKDFADLRYRQLDQIRSAFGRPLRTKPLLMACSFLTATVAWAHDGASAIRPDNFWLVWSWESPVLAVLIFSAAIYLIGVTRLWKRSTPERRFAKWRVVCFLSGWLVMVLVLVSPLHELGQALFSARMTQHELLMIIAAPLLVLSRPLIPMLMALPPRSRMLLGAYSRRPRFSRTWVAVTNPIAAWLIYGITLWTWHVPALYQLTLQNQSVHALQYASFLGSALLFWWTLIHGRYGRMGYGGAVIYAFTTTLHSSVLGGLFTFSSRVWYPSYLGRMGAWHLTAIQDQRVGGLIMWVLAGVVLIGTSFGFLWAMLRESEQRRSYSIVAVSPPAAERSSP